MGTHHLPLRACSCELALRALGPARGRLGGAPLARAWGVRGRALSHPRPLVLWGVRPGPTTHWLLVPRVRAWGPVSNPTAHALASWLCALWGWHEGARGRRLFAGCGASGVGRSATPDRASFGACRRGPLPTGCGCGGCGRGDQSPIPQRALLRAGFARCGGGTRAPGGGASCLAVQRLGWGALPAPTARPLRLASGARAPLALRAGCLDVGTRHQFLSARSCELALRAVGGARGRPGGVPLAWVWGVWGRALSDPLPPVICGVRPGPATHWLWVRCAGVGARLSLAPSPVRRFVVCCAVCGTGWPLWLGTCPRAVVLAGGVPLWRTSWPRVGAPRRIRSGPSRCSVRLPRRRGAFSHPGGCRPWLYWVAAQGTWRPADYRAHCACRWPLPRQGRWGRSASYPFGAPRWGCPWRLPPASVYGCVRCGGWRAWTRSLTRPVSRTVRLLTGDSAGAPELFRVDADTSPPRPGPACVCVCACSSWPGWAGLRPGRILVRLTFPCGRSWCASCLLGPPRAWVALFAVVVGCFLLSFFFAPLLSPAFRVFRPWLPWP